MGYRGGEEKKERLTDGNHRRLEQNSPSAWHGGRAGCSYILDSRFEYLRVIVGRGGAEISVVGGVGENPCRN